MKEINIFKFNLRIMLFDNKTILLTGGTGSFGQQFTQVVLENYNIKTLRVFSRGELLQWEMRKKFRDPRIRFLIGDIRDRERLYRAMSGVDIVVHAAALKQIPAIEYNPIEAIKTNVMGTANIVDAAIDNNVERAVLISSDKAVSPINLYGAAKLCAEKLFVQANVYTGAKRTKFSCVRYGNVIASRGSVIPLFLQQREKGVLTITDKRMTRFWITLDQGVKLVTNSIKNMKGGEIFVPKIPSMKIIDLAEAIAPDAKMEVIGVRPGEKLHEILLSSEEASHSKEFENHFVIEPRFSFWRPENYENGNKLLDGFQYSSDNNKQWLNKEQLKEILKNLNL